MGDWPYGLRVIKILACRCIDAEHGQQRLGTIFMDAAVKPMMISSSGATRIGLTRQVCDIERP
jgi:hypothetical protein